MANFEEESTMVCDLAKCLGIGISNPTNPNRASLETGMDVLTLLAGRKIGVQVTVYHADEAQGSGRKGSSLRKEEEKKARQALRQVGVKAYGMGAPANYIPPMQHRIGEKISIADKHTYDDIDELWLLVAIQHHWGATGSTFIDSKVVKIDDLNDNFSSMLLHSRFDKAFLLFKIERVVYQWTKEGGWRLLNDKAVLS